MLHGNHQTGTRPSAAPLTDVRIFDMTTAAAGPWASLLLGSLGATVFKIEPPGQPFTGDMAVRIPPSMRGVGTLWITTNMFKKSVALDFKNPEQMALGRRLAASCDVFVENMRPGVVDRLGFGYEALREVNQGIVYLSVTGYGQFGPMANEACTDPLAQAFSGWAGVTGRPGSAGELYRHYAHVDLTTASYTALTATLLLHRRRRTGQGGRLNISMLDAALANQTTKIAEYAVTGEQPRPAGTASARTAPNQAFRCRDGRWLTVAVESEDCWPRFCEAIGAEDLTAAFPTNVDRVRHRRRLARRLEKVFGSKPARWWELRLTRAGVPNGRILTFDELLNNSQIRANGMLVQVDTPEGAIWTGAPPIRFQESGCPPISSSAPGADTVAVIAELEAAAPPEVAAVRQTRGAASR